MVFGLKILKLMNKLFNKGEIPFKRCTLFSRQIFLRYFLFFAGENRKKRDCVRVEYIFQRWSCYMYQNCDDFS